MKKIVFAAMCMAAAISLTGCGEKQGNPAGAVDQTAEQEASGQDMTEENLADSAEDNDALADNAEDNDALADSAEDKEAMEDHAEDNEAPADLAEDNETSVDHAEDNDAGDLSQEQVLAAVKNYCYDKNPDMKDKENSDEYTMGWEVSQNENGEIVVLLRSYTGAQIRYYVDPSSGDAYVTELVPGIIDEEQKTDETLNVREYLE